MMKRMRRVLICAAVIAQATGSVAAQTSGSGTPLTGIGLTQDHKRVIYDEVVNEPARRLPAGSNVTIGSRIPDSIILNEMPVSLKDKVGVLRDFKFAKLPDESIVIVDPAARKVVDIVTKQDSGR